MDLLDLAPSYLATTYLLLLITKGLSRSGLLEPVTSLFSLCFPHQSHRLLLIQSTNRSSFHLKTVESTFTVSSRFTASAKWNYVMITSQRPLSSLKTEQLSSAARTTELCLWSQAPTGTSLLCSTIRSSCRANCAFRVFSSLPWNSPQSSSCHRVTVSFESSRRLTTHLRKSTVSTSSETLTDSMIKSQNPVSRPMQTCSIEHRPSSRLGTRMCICVWQSPYNMCMLWMQLRNSWPNEFAWRFSRQPSRWTTAQKDYGQSAQE